ncbi:TPA: IS91 family transposase [Klebsiella pneumoniae]|nr:IS91 family transposase [Klebsiella pneumoniae]HDT0339930.1 IS91 family transposase [Klebsiella pneumoniae]
MSLARNATASQSPTQTNGYERHQPDQTLLYQLVEQHYPAFKASLEAQGQHLPRYIQQEFNDLLQCGRLEYGFMRVRCEDCHHERLVAFSCKRRGFCPSCGARRMAESAALLIDEVFPKEPIRQWVLSFPFQLRFLLARHPQLMGQVLSIVYRTLSTHLIKKAGYTKASAQTGSVTLIQRFGSALNLNVHYHMLFLDGVYAEDDYGKQRFHRVKAPTYDELNTLAHTLSHRIARCMEKRGILERDAENTWLTLEEGEDDTLTQLHGASVTYRIAVGPQQGRKVFTLQTLPGREDKADSSSRVANHDGFSLHAGVMAEAHQRDKLERLCRYISRPAVSEKRLALTANGQVRYELKTPYRNGTTHVIFEPLDFIAKLAALVPKPRVNLTRFHGVFAPNSKHRVQVTPAKRGKKPDKSEGLDTNWRDKSPAERHRAMTWMQRLKRVFNIDIEVCEHCGGHVKVIASIEDPKVIEQILKHLKQKTAKANAAKQRELPPERAPPLTPSLFDPSQSRLFD